MAAVVASALAGGALLGRCATTGRSLAGVAVLSLAVLAAVGYLAAQAGLGDIVALLAVAAFMFSLVIGTAATLVSRKVWRRRLARHSPAGPS
ncbi:hypothetical protein [Bordetella sp. BOR01]|uniref:hypothetical protein n=1 Tax=Bordetella sp. BOR01 TaxID=2854779 RepID=UPI001C44D9B8|nr:hypothetical protein [Bordetella sp. BOR01]MBV7485642.1 hypothetical protein [Bordetella sp. BOR01]